MWGRPLLLGDCSEVAGIDQWCFGALSQPRAALLENLKK